MPTRYLGLLSLLVAAGAASAVERSAAPSEGCLDARAVVQARAVDEHRLLIDTGTARYALTTAASCPAPTDTAASLLSPQGWVCGDRPEVEFVQVGALRCAIENVEPLSAKAFAAEIREADRGRSLDGTPSLAQVEVQAKAPDRGRFLSSTAYCFDPRWVRGWRTDGKDMLVDTSARRSGGNDLYRVELGRSCPELELSQSVTFHSVTGGAICGHPGDHAKVQRGLPAEMIAGGVLSTRASTEGCPITAVYPVHSSNDS